MVNAKPYNITISPHSSYLENFTLRWEEEIIHIYVSYSSVVGSLMYNMIYIGLDIYNIMGVISQYIANILLI